jgi:8-oxo-dGTP diphosphatase
MIDVVCGVIENSDGRFLACLRPQGKHLAGLWEFPGGKVNPDESPECALARELQEELGIKVIVGTPLEPVHWNYDRGSIRLLPFFCTITVGQPQAFEHEQLLWCAPEDFATLCWAEADLPVLAQILARIAETAN